MMKRLFDIVASGLGLIERTAGTGQQNSGDKSVSRGGMRWMGN